ncbi:MAG: VWA domain-containing protein, partial [Gemmatimonadaceae bacterium]|nr:VWA domain-containing protein [Gemmatimonadaceae bacterium]
MNSGSALAAAFFRDARMQPLMPLTVSLGEHLPPLVLDTPFWALLAIVLPLVVGWLRRQRAVQRERRLARYAEATALARLVPMREDGERRRTWRLITAAALIGLAMAGPRWGLARGPVSSRGIDMAIALDASLSMMAPDEKPNRLERMKQEVRRLRAMSQADRVALIAFAGRSYILTPLTSDDGALELFLENLDPSVVGQAGSSIAKAMRQGTELLLASDGSADRALVVMTDGESFDPVEDVETAAREAGAKGVSVVTVGFGTARGSTIPARRSVDTREDHVPRFLWLLVPALLLLVYDSWRLVAPAATAAAPAMLSWLLVLVPTVFLGCAAEPDPAALFKEGRVADAIAAYRAMVAQGDTSARTVYNLGSAILGA